MATACRILGHLGLAEDILGHVSMRVGPGHLLVRCRGPQERGLLFTTEADVRKIALDDEGDVGDGYVTPKELPIHVEVMRSRPDVVAVVHAHPPAVVAVDLTGEALRPIVGAYNIPAVRMAVEGIPVYARSVLIQRADLAREMLAAMGDRPVCVLRGHGLTATGASVEQAVSRALAVDSLARMTLMVLSAGGTASVIPDADLDELPDLGSGFNDLQLWRHHEARLAHAGLTLD